MYWRHIGKWGLAIHWWDLFSSMSYRLAQTSRFYIKCLISPILFKIGLCNVLETYRKVGSSNSLVGLVKLYELPVSSNQMIFFIKCLICSLLFTIGLCNELETYRKVGSSNTLVGLVLLYELQVSSNQSIFAIHNRVMQCIIEK